jgi:copper chaperone CopZ
MHLEDLEDELPGVKRINAMYKKQRMIVEYDEAVISVEQIIAAANTIGYHPVLVKPS